MSIGLRTRRAALVRNIKNGNWDNVHVTLWDGRTFFSKWTDVLPDGRIVFQSSTGVEAKVTYNEIRDVTG